MKFEEWMVGKQEDKSLAHGARGTKDRCTCKYFTTEITGRGYIPHFFFGYEATISAGNMKSQMGLVTLSTKPISVLVQEPVCGNCCAKQRHRIWQHRHFESKA